MPLIKISTSVPKIKAEDEFLKAISLKITELTGKPEKYVMVCIQTNVPIMFGGGKDNACYIEVKSIGALNPSKMSFELCNTINNILGIDNDRIYINFEEKEAKNWGYNASTFG